MLIRMPRTADQVAHFLDYREKAPAAATANMYLDAQGNVIPGLSTPGYKAIGVPGTVAGLVYAQKHYGKLSLARVMAPAIRLATRRLRPLRRRGRTTSHAANLASFPESRRHLPARRQLLQSRRHASSSPNSPPPSTHRRRPRQLLQRRHGRRNRRLRARQGGGLITAADLAAYEVKDREPAHRQLSRLRRSSPRRRPPPAASCCSKSSTSSPATTSRTPATASPQQACRRTPTTCRSRRQQVHLITEAFRRAYMDRTDYLGDPDFVAHAPAADGRPRLRRRLAQDHRPAQALALRHARPPRRLPASAAQARALARVPRDHPLLRRRRRGQRRLQHLHPQLRLRLRRHRRLARLPAQRRDGRLHLQARRAQQVRPHPGPSQRHRARQAPALRHDAHHRHRARAS